MSELDVRAAGEHAYEAEVVSADGATTTSQVAVETDVLVELGATDADEPLVVRRALELVLEVGGALPERTSLGALGRDYPALLPELGRSWR